MIMSVFTFITVAIYLHIIASPITDKNDNVCLHLHYCCYISTYLASPITDKNDNVCLHLHNCYYISTYHS